MLIVFFGGAVVKLLVRLSLDRNVKGWSRSCGAIFLHGETWTFRLKTKKSRTTYMDNKLLLGPFHRGKR